MRPLLAPTLSTPYDSEGAGFIVLVRSRDGVGILIMFKARVRARVSVSVMARV